MGIKRKCKRHRWSSDGISTLLFWPSQCTTLSDRTEDCIFLAGGYNFIKNYINIRENSLFIFLLKLSLYLLDEAVSFSLLLDVVYYLIVLHFQADDFKNHSYFILIYCFYWFMIVVISWVFLLLYICRLRKKCAR